MHARYIRNEVAADEEAGGRREGGEGGVEGQRDGGSLGTGSGITAFFSKDHWGA